MSLSPLRTLLAVLGGLLSVGSHSTWAQSRSDEKIVEVHGAPSPAPASALWWESGRNGNFWSIDVGPGGYAFVQFSTFDEQRQPTFLTMQGQLELLLPGESLVGESLRLRSPLYQLDGGPCLGCDYTPAVVSQSRFGTAALYFSSPTQASFVWRGISTQIERFPLFTRAVDLLDRRIQGRYQVIRRAADGAASHLGVEVVPAFPPLSGWRLSRISLNSLEELRLLQGVQIVTAPGTNQFSAVWRDASDFYECFRCPCSAGFSSLDYPLCVPDDFASRPAVPLSFSGDIGDSLQLSAGIDDDPAASRIGTLSMHPYTLDLATDPAVQLTQQPGRGLWWEAGRNGQFWSIDIGPGGYMFVNLATFDDQGKPTFLTMQGQYQPSAQRSEQLMGRLQSPLYRLTGGQCLGCEFQPATVMPSELGDAEIEFSSSTDALFRWNGRVYPISKFPLYNRVEDLPVQRLAGTYRIFKTIDNSSFNTATVELQPIVPACPAEAGSLVLGVYCTAPFCAPPAPWPGMGYPFPEFVGAEIHVAPGPHSKIAIYKAGPEGCSRVGWMDEREGRLDFSSIGLQPEAHVRLFPLQ